MRGGRRGAASGIADEERCGKPGSAKNLSVNYVDARRHLTEGDRHTWAHWTPNIVGTLEAGQVKSLWVAGRRQHRTMDRLTLLQVFSLALSALAVISGLLPHQHWRYFLKLFYTPGSCSLSPHIVLRELALRFALEAVDQGTKMTASGADFTAINPKGYVPALQLDDGEVLTEGAAIVQYLVDKYAPGTLAPLSGTVERARVNGHLNFIATELHKGCVPLFNPAMAPEARETVTKGLERKLEVMEQILADGRPYLTGPDFTVADAYLFTMLSWSPRIQIDLERWPDLAAFSKRVLARKTVQAALEAEGLR